MENHYLLVAYVKDGRVMGMSDGISLRGFEFTWPLLTDKMQQENPVEYEKCILYIKKEKLCNGFVAKRICKANSNGTKITFKKAKTREEAKEAAGKLIDEYFDLVERRDKEQGGDEQNAGSIG